MQLPRFLWVPFPLGRPFGAPHEPEFQRRVLRSALALLTRDRGPVLEDFPDDAPVAKEEVGDEGWSCPVSFAPVDDGRSTLVRAALDEVDRLQPWIEQREAAGQGGFGPVGSIAVRDVVEAFGAIVEGEATEVIGDGVPLQEWVRLGCDDLHAFAIEASKAQPGHASPAQREDWFWKQTALARLVGETASALVDHESLLVQALARRAMVPRVHMAELMPTVDPVI